MICKEMTAAEVCFTDAAGVPQTLVAHYEYGENAEGKVIIKAIRYTDAAGATVDTAAGIVVAGACPVASPDVEWEKLCDVAADGSVTSFLCRTITRFDAAGAPIDPSQVDYFELDKVTAYVPAGDVVSCDDCAPAVPEGVLTTWG